MKDFLKMKRKKRKGQLTSAFMSHPNKEQDLDGWCVCQPTWLTDYEVTK